MNSTPLTLNRLRRFWILVFVSFLFLRLSLAEYWGAENRFWVQWQRPDLLAIVGAILAVAGVMFIVRWAAGLFGRIGVFVRDIGYLMFALFYFKVAAMELLFVSGDIPFVLSWSLNALLFAVIVFATFRRGRLIEVVDGACLILSPIVPIYVATLLFAEPIPQFLVKNIDDPIESRQSPVTSIVKNDASPEKVLIFVFDAMSYHRIVGGGLNVEEFPNLRRIADVSLVFSYAYSTANSTKAAVPGMLCGTNGASGLIGSIPCLLTEDGSIAVRDMPSLFLDMKKRGYHTGIHGSALPYAAFFPAGLDEFQKRNMRRPGTFERTFHTARKMLYKHMTIRLGPVMPNVEAASKETQKDWFLGQHKWLHNAALTLIAGEGKRFDYIHYRFPHYPLMYDRGGVVDISEIVWNADWDEDAYIGNLRYMDTKLGELLDAMQSSPDYATTLFIITGDHSVRSDPLLASAAPVGDKSYYEYCHVPLLIHLPGQQEMISIDAPFPMSKLRGILNEYMDSSMSIKEFSNKCSSFKQSDIKCAIDMSKIF